MSEEKPSGGISRRRFLIAATGLTAAAVSLSGPNPEQRRARPIMPPPDMHEDHAATFDRARKELDAGIDAMADDITALKARYGISKLLGLKHVQVDITPAYGSHNGQASVTLNHSAEDTVPLPGLPRLMDACMKMEMVYDDYNRCGRHHEPQHLDYESVTTQVFDAYSKKNDGKPLPLPEPAQDMIAGQLRSYTKAALAFSGQSRSTPPAQEEQWAHTLHIPVQDPIFGKQLADIPMETVIKNQRLIKNHTSKPGESYTLGRR